MTSNLTIDPCHSGLAVQRLPVKAAPRMMGLADKSHCQHGERSACLILVCVRRYGGNYVPYPNASVAIERSSPNGLNHPSRSSGPPTVLLA